MDRLCKCGCGEKIISKFKHVKFIKGHNNTMWKGKKLEERHGIKKAKKIRLKQSKSYEERFGKKIAKEKIEKQSRTLKEKFGIEKAKKMKENMSKAKKGITLKQRYGEKKAKKIRLKQSKPYEKRYGEKKAKELIAKKTKLFDINILKETLENVFKYENNVTKGKFYKNKFVLQIGTDNTIRTKLRKKGFELEELAEECNLQFKKRLPFVGNNEIEILDYYAKINNVDIDKRCYVGRLKPDGAIHELKKFVEVDEFHHPYQQVKDIIRENIMKEKTGYSFIRLDEQEWLRKMENQNNKTLEDF